MLLLFIALMLVPSSHAQQPPFADPPYDFGESRITPALVSVNMNGMGFAPAAITIRRGDKVRWFNSTNVAHTVTADPARATNPSHLALPQGATPFHSGDIPAGGVYTRVFSVAGDYKYFCVPHQDQGMIGTIRVLP